MQDHSARHRLFAEDLSGGRIELSSGEAHHARDVLRLSAGDVVELFDGAGAAAVGALETLSRRKTVVRVARRRTARERPEPVVELAFAVPKGRRLDWLLEKATELGAARLSPVVFERSIAAPRLSSHARGRWQRICISAAKQCGADFLPEIAAPAALTNFLNRAAADVRVLGDPDGDLPAATALAQWCPSRRIVALAGPEGGLTGPERRAAVEAGFSPVRLGGLVLRIETAALALLAAVTAFCQTPPGRDATPDFTNPRR